MHALILAATGGGHERELLLLGVLLGVAALLLAAYRTGLPYPILLVVGGGALGFIPGLPDVTLDPDLILLIFLPPLLHAAAFFSSLHDLRDNARPIGLLAIGLVIATMLLVGVVAHAVIDDLGWAAAFTLGAILAPTDPVAASAIAARVGAPSRFVTIVEGEALVNDSTGLITYKIAVAAVATGSFSLLDAAGEFVLSAVVGVAVGIAVGTLVGKLRKRLDDPPTEITISLLAPYFAYLPAEALGVSAVLAAVTAGVWLGWRSPEMMAPSTRIQTFAVWEVLTFVLNAALFVLLGLQLPGVIARISDQYATGQLVLWGAVVAATVIAVRFLWVFPTTYLPRWASVRLRERDPLPHASHTLLVAWTGMRGAVSVAAALALPLSTDAGAAFPARDLIIFLVYVTMLATILLQGLSLAPLLRRLDIEDDGRHEREEAQARIKAARRALARLDELVGEDWVREASARRLRDRYEFRLRRFRARVDDDDDGAVEHGSRAYQRLSREVLEAERAEIIRLRNDGQINDDVLHRIERDLDLEDARLDLPSAEHEPASA